MLNPLETMLPSAFKRYIPLVAWIVAGLTLLLIPIKILSYGYLPPDDALRHAAKAVSGKPWEQIMVMRSDFPLDPYPGWHTVLGTLHGWLGGSAETLVVISIGGLMLLLSIAVLLWLRRPEAWLAGLLVLAIFSPDFTIRLALGRPYLFTMASWVFVLFAWSRMEDRRPRPWELFLTMFLFALITWIHGSWYQLVLLVAAFALAGRWRHALWLGGCWASGTFLGASFTGHPFQFLNQSLRLLFSIFGDHSLTRQLETELMPSTGNVALLLAVAVMLVWRTRSQTWRQEELLPPAFVLAILGWLLGLKVNRFWSDWGLPATLVWLTIEFQKQFEEGLHFESARRVLITAGLAMGLFLATTTDRESRWTWNISSEYLTEGDPRLAGWLPEKQGILYCTDMRIFHETFFKNPKANWRYVLGFEPGLMIPEDLAVFRKVQWSYGDPRAY